MAEQSGFGDWEPADSYVPDNDPDPFQVARRIHEDRTAIDALAGRVWLRWPQLSEQERQIAVDLGQIVTDRMVYGDTPTEAAMMLHQARCALDAELADWYELDADERELAVELMEATQNWLNLEGSRL